MENLRQVFYNFNRTQSCTSTTNTSSVSCSTNIVTNDKDTTSILSIQQPNSIQMPLIGSTSATLSIPGVVTSSNSPGTIPNPLILSQHHVALMPNPPNVADNNREVEPQRIIKTQVQHQQQQHNHSPMNMLPPNVDPSVLCGTIGNDQDGAVAVTTIGAAGGEGPSCNVASAANKSSDDSSDCQG
jgi:hypothetical protein